MLFVLLSRSLFYGSQKLSIDREKKHISIETRLISGYCPAIFINPQKIPSDFHGLDMNFLLNSKWLEPIFFSALRQKWKRAIMPRQARSSWLAFLTFRGPCFFGALHSSHFLRFSSCVIKFGKNRDWKASLRPCVQRPKRLNSGKLLRKKVEQALVTTKCAIKENRKAISPFAEFFCGSFFLVCAAFLQFTA